MIIETIPFPPAKDRSNCRLFSASLGPRSPASILGSDLCRREGLALLVKITIKRRFKKCSCWLNSLKTHLQQNRYFRNNELLDDIPFLSIPVNPTAPQLQEVSLLFSATWEKTFRNSRLSFYSTLNRQTSGCQRFLP